MGLLEQNLCLQVLLFKTNNLEQIFIQKISLSGISCFTPILNSILSRRTHCKWGSCVIHNWQNLHSSSSRLFLFVFRNQKSPFALSSSWAWCFFLILQFELLRLRDVTEEFFTGEILTEVGAWLKRGVRSTSSSLVLSGSWLNLLPWLKTIHALFCMSLGSEFRFAFLGCKGVLVCVRSYSYILYLVLCRCKIEGPLYLESSTSFCLLVPLFHYLLKLCNSRYLLRSREN